MNKSFSNNLLFLITVNLLIKPFFIFGIDRSVQNRVGAETYGMYAVLSDLAFIALIINDFGIQNFSNRLIAQSPHLLKKYFSNLLILKIALSFFYTIITICLFLGLGYEIKYLKLIFLLIFNSVLNSVLLYFRSCISGLGAYQRDSWLSVIDKFCLILFSSLLLWLPILSPHFCLDYFVYAQTISLIIALFIAFQWIIQEIKTISFRFNYAILWILLRRSYPYALLVFLMTLATKTDKMLIEGLLADGKAQAGSYAAAYRLYDAANIIGFLFAGLLMPMFAKRLKANEDVRDLLELASDWIWIGAVGFVLSILPFRQSLMSLLYTHCSPHSGDLLAILMISFVANALGSYIYGALLSAGGFLKPLARIFLIAFVLNIILNLILIPKHQNLGAAAAALTTQIFALIAQIFLAQKSLQLPTNYIRIVKYGIYAILLAIIAFSLANILPTIHWIAKMGIIGITGMFLAGGLKLTHHSTIMAKKNG